MYTTKDLQNGANQLRTNETTVQSAAREKDIAKRAKKGTFSVSDLEYLHRDSLAEIEEEERKRREERLEHIKAMYERRAEEAKALQQQQEDAQRQFDIRAGKEEREADRLVTNKLKRDFSAPDDRAKNNSTYQKYKEVMTQDKTEDYDPYLNAVRNNGSTQGFARQLNDLKFFKNLANRISATGNTATMEDGYNTASKELSRLTDDERNYLDNYVKLDTRNHKAGYRPAQELEENKSKFLKSTGMSEDDFDRYREYSEFVMDYNDRKDQQARIRANTNTGNVALDNLNTLGYSIYDLALSPVEGTAAFLGSFKQPKDSRMPVNTNNGLYKVHNYTRDIEEIANENINNFYGEGTKGAKIASFAYNTAISIGKAAYAMATGQMAAEGAGALGASEKAVRTVANAVTLPQFGSTAFASTFQDAQKRGLTNGQAYSLAMASGLAEMGTEVFSLDHFWDIAKNSGKKAAKSALVDWLVQAGIEGSEEVASDVINEVADRAIAGDKSEYEDNVKTLLENNPNLNEKEARWIATTEMLKQWLQDFAGGAVSGFAFGGVHFGVNASRAKQLFAEGNYQEFADSIDTDRNSYDSEEDYKKALSAKEQAEKLAAKKEAGKKITNDDKIYLNNLLEETVRGAKAQQIESKAEESKEEQRAGTVEQLSEIPKTTIEDVPILYDNKTTHGATVKGNLEQITPAEAYV